MSEDTILVVIPMAVTVTAQRLTTMECLMRELGLDRGELTERIFHAGLASLEIEASAMRK